MTRKQWLDLLGSGQLKYAKLETAKVAVLVYGDAAVVRGVSAQQRRSVPGSGNSGEVNPFTESYTLMFINKGGAWRVAAMHSSGGNYGRN